MNVRLAGSLGVWLVACAALAAADFWQEKDFTAWSTEEVEQMLTASPWSRQVTITLLGPAGRGGGTRGGGVGGGAGVDIGGDGGYRQVPDDPDGTNTGGRGREDGFATAPERMTLTVSWRSALPVKQALVRARVGADARIPLGQRQFLAQLEPFYVVSVGGIPRHFARMAQDRDALLAETILKREGKGSISAWDVEVFVEHGETVIFEYAFLRADAIIVDDQEAEFIPKLGPFEVKSKFKLEDMVFDDQLTL